MAMDLPNVVSRPHMCLCMIVKNEEHVVLESLQSVLKYIDYYVISDTGSTDRTKEVIKNFFDKHNVRGEIYDTPWKNFGYNRSEALALARGKADYIWMFDADDIIEGEITFPEKMELDGYLLNFDRVMTYQRIQIFKGDVPWIYEGVLHEHPKCLLESALISVIPGDYYVISRRLGARNKDPLKYQKDAHLLEEELKNDPKNTRYMFYCAQSHLDYQNFERAEYWYVKRVEASGWDEEVYVSLLRIAYCKQKLRKPVPEILDTLFKATLIMPKRVEGYFELARIFRLAGLYREAYEYAKIGSIMPHNPHSLFSIKLLTDFAIKDELALAAFHMGYYKEALEITNYLVELDYPDAKEHMSRLRQNQVLFKRKVVENNNTTKPLLCIYLGFANAYDPNSMIYGSEIAVREVIKHLKQHYRITLVEINCQQQGEIEPGIFRIRADYFERYQEANPIDVLLISRYMCAFLEHTITAKKVYFWIHDVYIHHHWATPLPQQGKYFIENIDSRVNGYVALTNWHSKLLKSYYKVPENKFHIIGNGISPEKFQMDKQIKRIRHRFIYTSSPNRGLEKLIEYFHDIHKEFPDAELYVYRGRECFMKEEEPLLEEMKKYPYLHYMGKASNEKLALEFRKSDVWLYPTNFPETFCISALEAQYAGCVCICSNVTALAETVGDRGILLQSQYGSPMLKQEVLSAVRKVFSMDTREMRRKAQLWASQQTWKKRALCWKNLFENGKFVEPHEKVETSFPDEVWSDGNEEEHINPIPSLNERDQVEVVQLKATNLFQKTQVEIKENW